MSQNGLLDILIDFWGHFSGVQNGSFRTLQCTFGFSGSSRGSVAGQGVCKCRMACTSLLMVLEEVYGDTEDTQAEAEAEKGG